MAFSEPFKHQPLDLTKTQIRLFRLTTTTTSGRSLTGEIAIFDFKSCPEYIAVSYTWGPPNPTRKILIDGHSFTIRENLWQFMDTAKDYPKSWLWIDQICIDQSTVDEKNHQVGMMANIYAKASHVVLWLGPKADWSDEAIRAIHLDLTLDRPYPPGPWDHLVPDQETAIQYRSERDSPWHQLMQKVLLEGQEKPIQDLFRRPYWDRLWILQEVLNGRNILVFCGRSCFTWQQLTTIFTPGAKHNGTEWKIPVQIPDVVMSLIKEKSFGQGSHNRLAYILDTFAHSQCEDVRDKVFGLLSLVRESGAIPVNYSLTPVEVFFRALERILMDEMTLHIEEPFNTARILRDEMLLQEINDVEIFQFAEQQLKKMRQEPKRKHRVSLFANDMDNHHLLWAIENEYSDIVKFLAERGVDLEKKNGFGQTPLLLAAERNLLSMVALLVELGANLEARDNTGSSALIFAAVMHASIVDEDFHWVDTTPIVHLLLEKGANLKARNNAGHTALWLAACKLTPTTLITVEGYKVVSLLLKVGVETKNDDQDYENEQISIAARYGDEAIVKTLLKRGADPEAKNIQGESALSNSYYYQQPAITKLFLGNSRKKNGMGQRAIKAASEVFKR